MTGHHHGRGRGGFIEHTIQGLHAAMEQALYAEHNASASGLLQRLDPRVKVAALFALILLSAVTAKLWVVATVLLVAVILAALSSISLWVLAKRVWLTTLTLSGALALPAVFLTPGTVLYRLPGLELAATAQGLRTAALLVLRAETAATLALVLVFTTPWTHVLKALRMFRVPVVFVVILGMTCRYILLMLETAHEMFESRKSRTVGALTRGEQRRIAILSTGALLSRTLQLSNEVYLAMQARGFRGEVFILDDFRMKGR
jgi:cobalt/nickel transport system permease protein